MSHWLMAGMPISWQEASALYKLSCPLMAAMPPVSASEFFRELLTYQQLPFILAYAHKLSFELALLFSTSEESAVFFNEIPSQQKIYEDLVAALLASRLTTCWQKNIDKEINSVPPEYQPFSAAITPFSSLKDTQLNHHDKIVLAQLKTTGHREVFYFLWMQQLDLQYSRTAETLPTISPLTDFIDPLNLATRITESCTHIEHFRYFSTFSNELEQKVRFFDRRLDPSRSFIQKIFQNLGSLIIHLHYLNRSVVVWLHDHVQHKAKTLKKTIQVALAWFKAHFLWPQALLFNLWEIQRSIEPFCLQHPFLRNGELTHFLAQQLPTIRKLAIDLSKYETKDDAYKYYKEALLANRIAYWIQTKFDAHLESILQKHQVGENFVQYWKKNESTHLAQIDLNAMALLESVGTLANHYTKLVSKLRSSFSLNQDYFNIDTINKRLKNISQRAPISSSTRFEDFPSHSPSRSQSYRQTPPPSDGNLAPSHPTIDALASFQSSNSSEPSERSKTSTFHISPLLPRTAPLQFRITHDLLSGHDLMFSETEDLAPFLQMRPSI